MSESEYCNSIQHCFFCNFNNYYSFYDKEKNYSIASACFLPNGKQINNNFIFFSDPIAIPLFINEKYSPQYYFHYLIEFIARKINKKNNYEEIKSSKNLIFYNNKQLNKEFVLEWIHMINSKNNNNLTIFEIYHKQNKAFPIGINPERTDALYTKMQKQTDHAAPAIIATTTRSNIKATQNYTQTNKAENNLIMPVKDFDDPSSNLPIKKKIETELTKYEFYSIFYLYWYLLQDFEYNPNLKREELPNFSYWPYSISNNISNFKHVFNLTYPYFIKLSNQNILYSIINDKNFYCPEAFNKISFMALDIIWQIGWTYSTRNNYVELGNKNIKSSVKEVFVALNIYPFSVLNLRPILSNEIFGFIPSMNFLKLVFGASLHFFGIYFSVNPVHMILLTSYLDKKNLFSLLSLFIPGVVLYISRYIIYIEYNKEHNSVELSINYFSPMQVIWTDKIFTHKPAVGNYYNNNDYVLT